MAVRTNTTHEQVNATSLLYHLLIMGTLGQEVGGIAIKDVDILLLDINVIEEVIPHKAMIALGMVYVKTYILIHVEGHNILKTENTLFIQFNQMLIEAEGGAAGRATQDEWLFGCRVLLATKLAAQTDMSL